MSGKSRKSYFAVGLIGAIGALAVGTAWAHSPSAAEAAAVAPFAKDGGSAREAKDGAAWTELAAKDGGARDLAAKDGGWRELAAKDGGSFELSR